MASSGSYSKAYSSWLTLKTDWVQSKNVTGNYSEITCTHYLINTAALSIGSRSNSCNVGGVSKTFSSSSITTTGTHKLGTTKHKINHNTDGTKTVSFNTTFNIKATLSGNYVSSIVATKSSVKLDDIPRESSVTCASFYIGDSTTITINRASSNFTHTLKYDYGTLTGTIAEKTTETSIGWTPPTTFYEQIPNGTTGYGSVTCETYSGTTLVGTSTANFNAYAKASDCYPTVTGTIVDTNTDITTKLTGDSSIIVKYLSKPKVTISATPKNSARIESRKASWGDGQSATTAESTFSNGVTNDVVSVSATDSRGYITTTSYDLSTLSKWVEYIKLAFSRITLSRTESTVSTCNVKVSGNYYNGNIGKTANTFTLKYRYKEKGGTYNDYVTVEPAKTNDTFDYTATLSNIDYQKEYVFEFVAEDEAMIVSSGEKTLEKGQAIFRIGQDYTRTNGRIIDEYGTEVLNGMSKYKTGGVDIDPNNTLEELILTETNTPMGGFWYIKTMFYSNKSTTSNRTQVAYPYAYNASVRACTYMRTYVTGTGWSAWALTSARSESGWVTITPTAPNTPTAVYVAFKNTYNKVPNVVTSVASGVVGTQVTGHGTNGISKTGVNIVLTRTNTTATNVFFQVMEEV